MDSDQVMVDQDQTQLTDDDAVAVVEADAAEQPEDAQEGESRPTSVEALKPGMRMQGTVRNVVDFGAFIDIGVGRDGLAHVSTLQRAGIDKTLKVGDTIDVQIRRVDLETNRISLTIPGAGRGTKTALADLAVGSQVPGRVVRLVDFGAFVDIGAQTDGLLHISQLSNGYVGHPSDVLTVGDEIKVSVLEVDTARRRISLSMKTAMVREMPTEVPEQSGPAEHVPTSFEVAWQEAMDSAQSRGDND